MMRRGAEEPRSHGSVSRVGSSPHSQPILDPSRSRLIFDATLTPW